MRFDVLTLFPEMVQPVLGASILKRAAAQGAISVGVHDIRAVATDAHKSVDDTPYGGGAGMLLRVDIIHAALLAAQTQPEVQAIEPTRRRTILVTPQGRRLTQGYAQEIADRYAQITLICGHYEGFDERVLSYVDEELSLGDFVLTGGELPALCVIDAVTRLLPQVLAEGSPHEESHSLRDADGSALLEYPHYTRPLEYDGMQVPEILRSGNHAAIAAWRLEQARAKTQARKERP